MSKTGRDGAYFSVENISCNRYDHQDIQVFCNSLIEAHAAGMMFALSCIGHLNFILIQEV